MKGEGIIIYNYFIYEWDGVLNLISNKTVS